MWCNPTVGNMYSCVCCTQMYICYFVVENLQNIAAKKQVKKRITYLVRAELTPSLCSCVNSSSKKFQQSWIQVGNSFLLIWWNLFWLPNLWFTITYHKRAALHRITNIFPCLFWIHVFSPLWALYDPPPTYFYSCLSSFTLCLTHLFLFAANNLYSPWFLNPPRTIYRYAQKDLEALLLSRVCMHPSVSDTNFIFRVIFNLPLWSRLKYPHTFLDGLL